MQNYFLWVRTPGSNEDCMQSTHYRAQPANQYLHRTILEKLALVKPQSVIRNFVSGCIKRYKRGVRTFCLYLIRGRWSIKIKSMWKLKDHICLCCKYILLVHTRSCVQFRNQRSKSPGPHETCSKEIIKCKSKIC